MDTADVRNAPRYVLEDIVHGWRNSSEDAHTVAVARAELERRDGAVEEEAGCEGHPAGPFDPMGATVYCDGSCRPADAIAELEQAAGFEEWNR